jgi:hypothetical protein
MNFGKIGQFGADSDPRAFNFDGEFEVAERGVLEFIEALKLDNEFLYDLLGATQEHQVKPKKFSQVEIDEFILAHTNAPEFEKLKNDKFMEALRDRMVKIDVPYLLRWSDEIKVLEHDYGPGKIKQHLMPHTLEIVALFGVLTRLRRADDEKLDLRTKAKLYDGKTIPNWTEDSVKELKDKYSDEGIQGGLSARYIQDKLSNCLARNTEYVNAFIVLNELREGLDNSSLITNPEEREYYKYCIELTSKELDEILKAEVQKALVANEDVMVRLCAKYIDNMIAYINGEKIINPVTAKLKVLNVTNIEHSLFLPALVHLLQEDLGRGLTLESITVDDVVMYINDYKAYFGLVKTSLTPVTQLALAVVAVEADLMTNGQWDQAKIKAAVEQAPKAEAREMANNIAMSWFMLSLVGLPAVAAVSVYLSAVDTWVSSAIMGIAAFSFVKKYIYENHKDFVRMHDKILILKGDDGRYFPIFRSEYIDDLDVWNSYVLLNS